MLRGINKKRILFFLAITMVSLSSFAQQYHFVYIQADNQQPFYVKYGSKNYSSTSIGYLILPKLSDGTFSVQVGFPKNLYPEQTFNLSIAGKDLGYALKNFDDKGWGLFNFQTTDVVMNVNAVANEQTAKQTTVTNNSNPFGNMLADAINDSTLNQQKISTDTIAAKPLQSNTNTDSSLASTTTPFTQTDSSNTSKVPAKTDAQPVTTATAISPSPDSTKTIDSALTNKAQSFNITKSYETTSSNGTDITFLDNASKDTVHAFIPSADTLSIEKKAAVADTAKGKVDNPFFNNTTGAKATAASDSTATTANSYKVNTSCQTSITSYEIDKLKKKVVSTDNQESALNAVRKALRGKCITTDQVKDLGNLFLSDENRYGFYETIYPFVYDYGNYSQLQNTLIDSNYKNRFKALLR